MRDKVLTTLPLAADGGESAHAQRRPTIGPGFHIFTKLDLRDRAAGVVFAFDHGLVRPGDPRQTDPTRHPTPPMSRPEEKEPTFHLT